MQGRTFVGAAAVLLWAGSTAWAADGAAVYRIQCAPCHGEAGKSETPVGKAMKIPPLAGDAAVAQMSPAEIAASIKAAERHPAGIKGMPSGDLDAVAAHVKVLAGGE